MNRAERRRQDREQKSKKAVYQYTEEQLQDMLAKKVMGLKEQVVKEVVDTVLTDYLTITLMVLYDKFDFDRSQLIDFKKKMDDLSDSVNGDWVTIQDLRLCMTEELNIDLLSIKGDGTTETSFDKSQGYKKQVLNSGIWFTYISFMKHLKEKLKVGAKRGLDLTEDVFNDVIKYANDNTAFLIDLQNFVTLKGNNEVCSKALDILNANDLLADEDIKKVMSTMNGDE